MHTHTQNRVWPIVFQYPVIFMQNSCLKRPHPKHTGMKRQAIKRRHQTVYYQLEYFDRLLQFEKFAPFSFILAPINKLLREKWWWRRGGYYHHHTHGVTRPFLRFLLLLLLWLVSVERPIFEWRICPTATVTVVVAQRGRHAMAVAVWCG